MKLKVLSNIYNVIKKKNLMEKEKTYGEIHLTKNIIYYDPSICLEQKHDVILHEALHAMDHQLGCGFSEKTTIQLTTALLQFMKDNKRFIREVIK